MLRKTRIVVFILWISTTCSAQTINTKGVSYFGRSYEVGTSLTYMTFGDKPGPFFEQQLTWNMNAKMKVAKRFWVGVQVIPIFTKQFIGGLTTKLNFDFYGAIVQGELVQFNGHRLYLEMSYNLSNLFESLITLPQKVEGIQYLGMGGGANILINPNKHRNLYLELAFFNYHILNKIKNKSNFTQYIIGINYRFGRKD